jgi:hypothetical protein
MDIFLAWLQNALLSEALSAPPRCYGSQWRTSHGRLSPDVQAEQLACPRAAMLQIRIERRRRALDGGRIGSCHMRMPGMYNVRHQDDDGLQVVFGRC